ncbi:MAG: HypC/HybG/HupF family hydrogenase formation chaperone [Anaerolineaceae bacterium]|nr:HypC/HybG/HupF family hydrogenase formation chaperone [Anaerolineaceae bacterium]
MHQQPAQAAWAYAATYCEPDAHGRCQTCSDDAYPAQIDRLLEDGVTAVAHLDGLETEIDISLVDGVAVGQTVLVHGGVALETVIGNP